MADIAMCTGARVDEDAAPLRLCHACRRFTAVPSEFRQVWIEPAARRVAGTSRFQCARHMEPPSCVSTHALAPADPGAVSSLLGLQRGSAPGSGATGPGHFSGKSKNGLKHGHGSGR